MSWFQRRSRSESLAQARRGAIFADAPLAEAAELDSDAPDTPSTRFHAALASLKVGDRKQAKAQLLSLLDLAAADTALSLQVWTCLRELGEQAPPGLARQVQGVVVEFGAGVTGTDTIAAYEDCTARAVDHAGVERECREPDSGVDDRIEVLLTAARKLVDRTPAGARPEAPLGGAATISVLTCGGIHTVRGDVALLERDPLCAPVLTAARQLQNELQHRPAPA